MKAPVFPLVFCLSALALGRTARADDVLPQPAPAKRYEKLAAHSPFAPPSAGPAPVAPAAPPPPGPTWSDNLTVTSLMQVHGVYTATVLEKNTSNKFFIRSDVENRESHLMVASVRWADRPEEIKVTLRKGTQFGDVRFEPAASGTGNVATGAPSAPPNRNMPAILPQPFHPPPPMPAMPGMPGPAGGSSNTVTRGRPIIRSAPLPGPPQNSRPVLNRQPAAARPALPGSKDDDDDDD